MKLTPSSTARRKTFLAFSRSGGQPQIPSPVSRIAPNPSRLTNRSRPTKMFPRSCSSSPLTDVSVIHRSEHQLHPRDLLPKTFFVSSQVKYVAGIDSQHSTMNCL